MADVPTRQTVLLPVKGDVVMVYGWGDGVLGIVREYDRNRPNRIVLEWPEDWFDLYWPGRVQIFEREAPLEIKVYRSPAELFGQFSYRIKRMCADIESRSNRFTCGGIRLNGPVNHP